MAKYSDEVPFLVAQSGPLNGQRWALHKEFILGREDNCDIVISDRQVSRHHARFQIVPDGVLLEDLGSKNGTHHNGTPLIAPVYLQDGDTIQIALAQRFVFLSSDSTIPLENQPSEILDLITPPGTTPLAPSEARRLFLEKKSRRVYIRTSVGESRIKEKEILHLFLHRSSDCLRCCMTTRAGSSPGRILSPSFGVKARLSIFRNRRSMPWSGACATGLHASIRHTSTLLRYAATVYASKILRFRVAGLSTLTPYFASY